MVKNKKVLDIFFDASKNWLVAVSGGRDSVCLLDQLVKAGCENLVVVHVNHQLRSEVSDADAQFVRELAEGYGLSFYQETADVAQIAETKQQGLELAAREARHAAFARAKKRFDAEGVFLGHHADDQAETVLYNLLRGSNGLRGMRAENVVHVGEVELKLMRPLLGVRRSEIDSYIEENSLSSREDATNGDGFTARNRIRNEVMPLLEEIMQREVVPSINSATESSMELRDYLDGEADLKQYLDPQGRVYLPAFTELHQLQQQALLFQYLQHHQVPEITRELVLKGLSIIPADAPAKINLPSGRWLRRKEQRLFIQE